MEQIEDTRQAPINEYEYLYEEVENMSLTTLFTACEDLGLSFQETTTIAQARESLVERKIWNLEKGEQDDY